MCEANVFLKKGTTEEEVMKEVLQLQVKGNEVFLSDLLGNELTLEAAITKIDFGQHKVLLEER